MRREWEHPPPPSVMWEVVDASPYSEKRVCFAVHYAYALDRLVAYVTEKEERMRRERWRFSCGHFQYEMSYKIDKSVHLEEYSSADIAKTLLQIFHAAPEGEVYVSLSRYACYCGVPTGDRRCWISQMHVAMKIRKCHVFHERTFVTQ